MKFTVTQPGVFDAEGKEVLVGKTIEADKNENAPDGIPNWLRNKVAAPTGAKTAVVNPAKGGGPVGDDNTGGGAELDGSKLTAEHRGNGSYSVMPEGTEDELVEGMKKAEADAFNKLSPEDKVAFVEKARAEKEAAAQS